MAASPAKWGVQAAGEEGRPLPHGVVVIRLSDNRPASAASEETVAFLGGRAGTDDGDAGRRGEGPFSLRRAAVAVLALAALAVAGYLCLYAGGGAGLARPFLAAPGDEEERGDRASFLLPLYRKARGGGGGAAQNLTGAVLPHAGNVFPTGEYYTTISLGSPPRPYFLDVDTGSDLTWIQCDVPCKSCAEGPHPLYRPAPVNAVPSSDPLCQGNMKSSGFPTQCDYDIRYADESSTGGVIVRDNMQLINENSESKHFDIGFGCGYDQHGNLLRSLANIDGVLGLSSAEISLPTQLASQGIISNVFGHCMTTDPRGNGYLFLGDGYIPRWGMTWVPIRNGPAYYNAEVQKVHYGDHHSNVQGLAGKLTRVIFDSGSTYTYFPHEAYTNLIAMLKDASPRIVQDDTDNTLPFCLKAAFPVRSVDDVKQFFKPLSLQFKNRLLIFPRTFTIPPEGYLIISDKGNVCLGVLDGQDKFSSIIIGDVSLRGKLVVYDNDENQIGWTNSDCRNPHKQSRVPLFLRRALRNQLL